MHCVLTTELDFDSQTLFPTTAGSKDCISIPFLPKGKYFISLGSHQWSPHPPGGSLHKQQGGKQRRVCITVPWAGPSCKAEIKGQLEPCFELPELISSTSQKEVSCSSPWAANALEPSKDRGEDVKGEWGGEGDLWEHCSSPCVFCTLLNTYFLVSGKRHEMFEPVRMRRA